MPLDVALPAYLGPFVQEENDQQKSQVDKLALFKSLPGKVQAAPSSPSFGQAQYSAAKLQAGIFLSARFRLELRTPPKVKMTRRVLHIDSHRGSWLQASLSFALYHVLSLCSCTTRYQTVPLSNSIFLV